MYLLSMPRARLVVGLALLIVPLGCVVVAGRATDEDSGLLGAVIVAAIAFMCLGVWQLLPPKQELAPLITTNGTTSPGWYRDPESPSMRFWDGEAWTDQRAPLPAQQAYRGPGTLQIGLAVAGGIALFVFLFGR